MQPSARRMPLSLTPIFPPCVAVVGRPHGTRPPPAAHSRRGHRRDRRGAGMPGRGWLRPPHARGAGHPLPGRRARPRACSGARSGRRGGEPSVRHRGGLDSGGGAERVRSDSKIVANSVLGDFGGLGSSLILVNPFETPAARGENLGPLRKALRWLSGGGLLVLFPAGEVASLNWKEHSITDPPWKTAAARLAVRAPLPGGSDVLQRRQQRSFSTGGRPAPHAANHRSAARVRKTERQDGQPADRKPDARQRDRGLP